MEQILERRGRKIWWVALLLTALSLGFVGMQVMPSVVRADGDTLLLDLSYKDADPREVSPGGTIEYSIVVKNRSAMSSTGQVDVWDTLEARLAYINYSARIMPQSAGLVYPVGGEQLHFQLFAMSPSDIVTLTFQAAVSSTVQPGELIFNTAIISDGVSTYTPGVSVTVQSLPTAQIDAPWNNQKFTDNGTVTIRGRVWNGSMPDNFPTAPTLLPISSGTNNWYFVRWQAVDDAMIYWLQESTTSDFSTITFEKDDYDAVTTSAYRSNMSRGVTYYYRVKARFLHHDSRWSTPVAVTVSTMGVASVDTAYPDPMLFAPMAPDAAPVVELVIAEIGSTSLPQTVNATVTDVSGNDWWDWSYVWSLPTRDDAQFTIESRGLDTVGSYDPMKTDMITVTVQNGTRYVYLPLIMRRYPPVPYQATMTLDSNDTYGNYQVSWAYNHTDPHAPTSYRLQEATDAGFSNLLTNEVIPVSTGLTRAYADKAVGTYYYRVLAINSYGSGPWSAAIGVAVNRQGYFDDFSDNTIPLHWKEEVRHRGALPGVPDGPVFDVAYENGSYRVKIMLNADGLNNRRMGIRPSPYGAPSVNYDLEVKHQFVAAGDQTVPPLAGKTGVIFAADSHFSAIYVVEWNIEGRCAVSKYTYTTLPTTIINFNNIHYFKEWGGCPTQLGYVDIGDNEPDEKRNENYNREVTVNVDVTGSVAMIRLNGHRIAQVTDSGLNTHNYVGLITGSWDRTPVESRFDDFLLMPE